MMETGLKEVANPSAIFLQRPKEMSPGSVVTVTWEGTRPLLVELQALVDESRSGYPRRIAVGLDPQRIGMHLAALHRHCGLSLTDQDVFANVVGGVRITETGADLATVLAVLSSFQNRVLPRNLVCFGELGLTGEVRGCTERPGKVARGAEARFRSGDRASGEPDEIPRSRGLTSKASRASPRHWKRSKRSDNGRAILAAPIASRYLIIVCSSDDDRRKALSLSVHAKLLGKARTRVGRAPWVTRTRQNPASVQLPGEQEHSQEIVEWQNPKFKTASMSKRFSRLARR